MPPRALAGRCLSALGTAGACCERLRVTDRCGRTAPATVETEAG